MKVWILMKLTIQMTHLEWALLAKITHIEAITTKMTNLRTAFKVNQSKMYLKEVENSKIN